MIDARSTNRRIATSWALIRSCIRVRTTERIWRSEGASVEPEVIYADIWMVRVHLFDSDASELDDIGI